MSSPVKRTRHTSHNLDSNPHYGERVRENLRITRSLDVYPPNHRHHHHHTTTDKQLAVSRSLDYPREQLEISEEPAQITSTNPQEPNHHYEKPSSCCTWQCCCRAFIAVFVIIGIAMAVAGIVLVLRYRPIFIERLENEMQLVSGSKAFDGFKNPPGGLVWKFFFYNLTNSEEVTSQGSKPRFDQRGPYTYEIDDRRENVEFNADETELKFTRRQFYYFSPEKSWPGYSENDPIISMDFVGFAGISGAAGQGMGQMAELLLTQYNRRTPFRKHSVGDLLWGSEDSLYDMLTQTAAVMGASPKKAPEKFGLLYGRNGSVLGNYTMYTGKGDIKRLEQIKTFNGFGKRFDNVWPTENVTDIYNNPFDANVFRGVTSGAFPPDVTKYSRLTAFVPTMCWSMDMKYWTVDNIGGVEMLKFGVDYPAFYKLSGEINRAMCAPADRDDRSKCVGPGLLNATKCFDNFPVILSWPNFLEADDYYFELIEDVRPRENIHAPYVDIDPLTGLATRVAERVQLNFVLRAMPYADYGNLPKFTLFPVVWMEQVGEISDDGIDKLKYYVYDKYYALRTLSYALLIASVILVPVSVFFFFVYQCRKNGGRCVPK